MWAHRFTLRHAAAAFFLLSLATPRVLLAQGVDVTLPGSLPVGKAVTVRFQAAVSNPVPAGAIEISAQGTVSATAIPGTLTDDPTTPALGDPTLTPILAAPDLSVALSDGNAAGVLPGGNIAYQLNYSNLGTRGASGVTLTVDVPGHAAVPGGASSPGWSCVPFGALKRCTRSLGSVAGGGASGNTTLVAALGSPLTPAASPVAAVAAVTDDGTNGADSVPTNNSAAVATGMGAFATTLTSLSSLRNPANVGDTVTYSFNVSEASGVPPTGSVQVKKGATTICSGTLVAGAGSCQASLSSGSHSLLGEYTGGGVFLSSTSSSLTETVINATPLSSGDVKIREFRLRGVAGAEDEYVELVNTTAGPITVGADGLTLRAASGGGATTIGTVPHSTILPAGGHYLFTNNTATTGFSVTGYSAGGTTVGFGDQSFTGNLADASGLALFKNGTFDLANRLDAVGFSGVTDTLYREGSGLAPANGVSTSGQWAFVRKAPTPGTIKDTGDNAADFGFVATDYGTYNGVAAMLGSPGPGAALSPRVSGAGVTWALADPSKSGTTFPNRWRVGTTYHFRWKLTNNTGGALSSLRLRVGEITTINSPGALSTWAAFIVVTSTGTHTFTVPEGTFTAINTVLEEPPTQAVGGGTNSTLNVPLPGGTWAAGSSIYVNFSFFYGPPGQGGTYNYFVTAEVK